MLRKIDMIRFPIVLIKYIICRCEQIIKKRQKLKINAEMGLLIMFTIHNNYLNAHSQQKICSFKTKLCNTFEYFF